MTRRRSKREIERALEEIQGDEPDHPVEIVIRETVVNSSWSPNGESDYDETDAAEGDIIEETETVIEL